MSELEVPAAEKATAAGNPPVGGETKDLCRGRWCLKPNIVLRVEEDGAILFDPDTDALTVVNPTASALLQHWRDRICFDEWVEALRAHYGPTVEVERIQGDIRAFLGSIASFAEACDGTCG
jgi:hypothetical protein